MSGTMVPTGTGTFLRCAFFFKTWTIMWATRVAYGLVSSHALSFTARLKGGKRNTWQKKRKESKELDINFQPTYCVGRL